MHPERKYRLEDIADAYGCRAEVDAAADELGSRGVGTVDPGDDWIADVLVEAGQVSSFDPVKKLWHVTCPFVDEHTGRADSGTAYLGGGRWTCHHGHCEQRDHADFTEKLRESFPDEWKKVTRRGLEIGGDEAVAPSVLRGEMEDIFGVEEVERAEVAREMGPIQKKFDGFRVRREEVEGFDACRSVPSVLKGLLPEKGMGVVYGASGIGKSFVVMDMVLRLAGGEDWQGYRNKARDGVWVYVSSEGGSVEVVRRMRGWSDVNGKIPGGVEVLATEFSFGAGGGEDAEELIKWCRRELGAPVRGLVLDTLNRNMSGDENSTADMTGFVDCAAGLWRALDCLVIVVHHEGKDADRGSRGSSVLRGAAEFEWRVFRSDHGQGGGVTVAKNRHGQDGMVLGFTLDKHVLGVDEDGDEVSTLVVKQASPPVSYKPVTRKYSKAIVTAYEDMLPDGEGWVDAGELAVEAANVYQTDCGSRVRPSEFRREMKEQLVAKNGWRELGEAICPPKREQVGEK